MQGRDLTLYPLFLRLCTLFFDGEGSMPADHCNVRLGGIRQRPKYLGQLTLLPLAALYLSTSLTAHAQFNPNLMKYACGPANRMFASLAPASRFPDTTAGFALISPPTVEGRSCTNDKPFFFS